MEVLRRWMPEIRERPTLYKHRGCKACGYTGYRGRQGIFELFTVQDRIRSAIVAGKDAGELAKMAEAYDYRPLVFHGCQKVLQGITTLSEVLRVTSV